jgi:hypothetical protein
MYRDYFPDKRSRRCRCVDSLCAIYYTHENWSLQDAGIVAFTCILDGPSTQSGGTVRE